MSKHGLMRSGPIFFFVALWTVLAATSCSKSHITPDAGASDAASDRPRDGSADTSVPDSCKANADAGPGTKELGETCACGFECGSGFCADGVCCNSACGASCMTCGLPTALGQCTFVPAGEADKESTCKKEATCGQDGLCDGMGGCEKYPAGTMCLPGKCDGNAITGGYVCDGSGQCLLGPAMSCSIFACDPASNACRTSCASNADCASGQQCQNGSCGKRPLGYVCKVADDCASGFCVDGVCCNTSCNTPCLSCDQTGYAGHCRLLAANAVDDDCKGQPATTCGNTGRCDAFGSCAKWPATTVCKGASCTSTILTTQALCDGNGTCGNQGAQECSPFLCLNGLCSIVCTGDNECAPDHQCTNIGKDGKGTCGKRKNGVICTTAGDCESGFCVDGVCCNNACTGGCRQCNMAGPMKGTCTNTTAGATDPRKTCNDNGAASCDLNGLCDGTGACQKYATGTQCAPETCKNGAYTEPSKCNGSHQCVAGASLGCAPYTCSGTKCATICQDNTLCVAPNSCTANSCGKKPLGAQCGADVECGSAHCAQGVCCNSTCTGACNACNLTGKAGTCSVVADGAADPQGVCKVTNASTCGTTGLCKAGACASWSATTPCKAASCPTTTTAIAGSLCNGTGTCVTPAATSCSPYVCSGGACGSVCSGDAMCAPPNICQGSSCGKKPNGTACTTATECGSGFCTEGVCCNTACTDGAGATAGLCQSCKVTGKVGTCSAVALGGGDLKNRCAKTDPVKGDCSNDGTCNGAGDCAHYPTTTTCGSQSCTAGSQKNVGVCNAAGACVTPANTLCGNYACDSTGLRCLMTCTADTDCATGVVCNRTTNRCGDKLGGGVACVIGTDCTSGFCTEGVCCDSACTDGCSSCLAGQLGVCSPLGKGSTPRVATKCPASTGTTGDAACGATGKCDGTGGCELAPATKTCTGPSCPSGGTAKSLAASCDGAGHCMTPASVSCNGFLCDPTMMSCLITCGANTDCAPGYICVGTSCQAKQANGGTCAPSLNGADCVSGNCVGGICCNVPANMCGTCKSCMTGTCTARSATTMDAACTATPSTACGFTGSCDGAGSCALFSPTTTCHTATCDMTGATAVVTSAAMCTGTGTCPATTTTTCATGMGCTPGVCKLTCTSNADCLTGYTCQGTTCAVPAATGGSMQTGTGGDVGGAGGGDQGGAGGA